MLFDKRLSSDSYSLRHWCQVLGKRPSEGTCGPAQLPDLRFGCPGDDGGVDISVFPGSINAQNFSFSSATSMSRNYTNPWVCQISYFHKAVKTLDSFPHLLQVFGLNHALFTTYNYTHTNAAEPSLIPPSFTPQNLPLSVLYFSSLFMLFIDSPIRCELHDGGNFCPFFSLLCPQ